MTQPKRYRLSPEKAPEPYVEKRAGESKVLQAALLRVTADGSADRKAPLQADFWHFHK